MTHDKMAEPKNKIRCRYFNTGFCKFEGKCRFFHAKAVCPQKVCKELKCQDRHPKLCRYKERCKRKSSCLYRHLIGKAENEQINVEYEKVLEENKNLISEIEVLKENINFTSIKLREFEENVGKVEAVKKALEISLKLNAKLKSENEKLKAELVDAVAKIDHSQETIKKLKSTKKSSLSIFPINNISN